MHVSDATKELDKVFTKFLELFDYEHAEILKKKAYFAGGCIYSLINDKKVNDYDIFLIDNIDMQSLIDLPFWKCKTEYALSFGKFQVVTKYFGNPSDCVGEFDFKHNMFFYVPFSGEIKSACDSFDYLISNKLVFNESRARDLEGVFLRIEKFKSRGFIIPRGLKQQIKKRTTPQKIQAYKKAKARRNKNFY